MCVWGDMVEWISEFKELSMPWVGSGALVRE